MASPSQTCHSCKLPHVKLFYRYEQPAKPATEEPAPATAAATEPPAARSPSSPRKPPAPGSESKQPSPPRQAPPHGKQQHPQSQHPPAVARQPHQPAHGQQQQQAKHAHASPPPRVLAQPGKQPAPAPKKPPQQPPQQQVQQQQQEPEQQPQTAALPDEQTAAQQRTLPPKSVSAFSVDDATSLDAGFTRSLRRAPPDARLVADRDAEVFCHMCYIIKFREIPDPTHATCGAPQVWTWQRFREHGFAPPPAAAASSAVGAADATNHNSNNVGATSDATLIINTGGTLSCVADPVTGLLSPQPLFSYLVSKIEAFGPDPATGLPRLVHECEREEKNPRADFVLLEKDALMIDSTNASYDEWNLIAMIIVSRMGRYRGFVVIHGTDTLAYTASALTFSLWGLTTPVVITGSQTPLRGVRGMLVGSTDALMNLLGAVDFVRKHHTLRSVFVYFHNKIMLGARVVKQHSTNFDGFHAPAVGVLGYYNGEFVVNGRLLEHTSRASDTETLELARHVHRHQNYYRKFVTAEPVGAAFAGRSPPTTTTAASHEGGAGNNNPNDDEEDEEGGAADAGAVADALLLAPSTPSLQALSNDALAMRTILPYFDHRHNCSIQRFHKSATVLVFHTRPGAFEGGAQLRDMLMHHGLDNDEPIGLVVLAYGAGNAQPTVADTLRWAREYANIPVAWTSQCFAGGSEGHYSVGLNSDHGVNVYDMTFEAVYTRLLLIISQQVFIQGGHSKTGEVDRARFARSREYRECVEDWMRFPHRSSFTPSRDAVAKTPGANDHDFNTVRDSAVAMYAS